jgi:hypothetical protein
VVYGIFVLAKSDRLLEQLVCVKSCFRLRKITTYVMLKLAFWEETFNRNQDVSGFRVQNWKNTSREDNECFRHCFWHRKSSSYKDCESRLIHSFCSSGESAGRGAVRPSWKTAHWRLVCPQWQCSCPLCCTYWGLSDRKNLEFYLPLLIPIYSRVWHSVFKEKLIYLLIVYLRTLTVARTI